MVDDYGRTCVGSASCSELRSDVVTASNGTEALEAVARERPDLVLLDVVMPGISGLDVCKALKHQPDTCLTPVVLISGTQERETVIAGLEAGADDFLNADRPEELYPRSLIDSLEAVDRRSGIGRTLFLTLGRISEARDPYTEGHCERLAEYAPALGRKLDLEQADIDALYRGAFLHDIGKIAIPDRILLKKGKLTQKEYALMKRHSVIGDELCATVRSLERVRPIVRHHHERLDGRGYPDGLSGTDIQVLAQIVSVVDVFDALTTSRPYRTALPTVTAYKMLIDNANRGWCHASMVEAFIELHRSRSLERVAV